VVEALGVTIDNFCPTNSFMRVDLPTFGLPMIVMNPDLKLISPIRGAKIAYLYRTTRVCSLGIKKGRCSAHYNDLFGSLNLLIFIITLSKLSEQALVAKRRLVLPNTFLR